jgi:hypothetical protein
MNGLNMIFLCAASERNDSGQTSPRCVRLVTLHDCRRPCSETVSAALRLASSKALAWLPPRRIPSHRWRARPDDGLRSPSRGHARRMAVRSSRLAREKSCLSKSNDASAPILAKSVSERVSRSILLTTIVSIRPAVMSASTVAEAADRSSRRRTRRHHSLHAGKPSPRGAGWRWRPHRLRAAPATNWTPARAPPRRDLRV